MEFSDLISKLEDLKSKGETENTWKHINTLLTEINAFVKNASMEKITLLNKYSNFYFAILNSQRSILVGTAVRLLISLSNHLMEENVYYYEYLRETLIVCGKANNIIYKYGNMLLDELVKRKSFSERSKCQMLLKERAESLNKKLRFSVFKAIIAHKKLYDSADQFDNLIKSGRADKAVEIRNLFKDLKIERRIDEESIRPSLIRRHVPIRNASKCSPASKKIRPEEKNNEENAIRNSEDEIFTPQRLKQFIDKYTKNKPIDNLVFEVKNDIMRAEHKEESESAFKNDLNPKSLERNSAEKSLERISMSLEDLLKSNDILSENCEEQSFVDESINNRTDEQLIKDPSESPFFKGTERIPVDSMKNDESVVEGNERVIIDFDDNMPTFDKEAKKTLDELLKNEINPEIFSQKISLKNKGEKNKLPFKSNKFEGLSLIENDWVTNNNKSEIIPFEAIKEENSSFTEEDIKKLSKSLNDMSVEKKSIHIESIDENMERSDRSFFSQFSIPELIDFEER